MSDDQHIVDPRTDSNTAPSESPALPDPSDEIYSTLITAHRVFNERLFGGILPPALVTAQRHRNSYGFFRARQFVDRSGTHVIDEIALNPEHFRDRTDKEILSTLLHEMVHQRQEHFGHPSRGGYHNKEWAVMMVEVGLIPSDTGQPGGKQTGHRVSHYIREGGPFDRICSELLAQGSTLRWGDLAVDAPGGKSKNKATYVCDCGCLLKLWGKPGIPVNDHIWREET
jgi:hypothetical protein